MKIVLISLKDRVFGIVSSPVNSVTPITGNPEPTPAVA